MHAQAGHFSLYYNFLYFYVSRENPSFFDKVFCLLFREKCINTISLYGMSTNRVKIKKGIYG